jgi:Squalene-hopene cyclase N-terminal domain
LRNTLAGTISARRVFIALLLVLGANRTFAGGTIPASADVHRSIHRGLDFLVKDALAWQHQHNCTSCHHAGLVIWSMREAKRAGFATDNKVLFDLTKWVAESGDGKTGVKRPASASKALNAKAVHYALALESNDAPDAVSQQGLKRLLATVQQDQTEDGSWMAWPETRPPIFGPSNETMTTLATLALIPAASSGDSRAKIARDRGIAWLQKTKTDDDPQSVAMRLVLCRRLHRPEVEMKPLVEHICNRQNIDGGWSQAKDMSSDAWATGQALYALALAGLGNNESHVARAHAFLIQSQRTDGSWPMTSRPIKSGGQGSTSLVPITGAGTAWAVIGLARSGGHSAN